MKNKSRIFIPVLLSAMLFTGCGARENKEETAVYNDISYEDNYDTPAEAAPEQDVNAENSGGDTDVSDMENNTSQKVIRKEMLVYSCNMSVDVLEFDNALESLKQSLDTYGAFPEKENYHDGKSAGKWVYEDDESWKSYNATIRVPSKNYEEFCEFIANLGDLRKKDANVDNLTSEYYDLSTTLEIYEAKEQRYIELLSTIDDEQTAIAIEKELTDIQIQISKLVTRMNEIQTDVAYSYVYVTINEVREYVEDEPEDIKEDTFGQRLKETVSGSFSVFLTLMEKLLFIFIYLLPHIITLGIFAFIILLIIKAVNKFKKPKFSNNIPPVSTLQTPAAKPASTSEIQNNKSETTVNDTSDNKQS